MVGLPSSSKKSVGSHYQSPHHSRTNSHPLSRGQATTSNPSTPSNRRHSTTSAEGVGMAGKNLSITGFHIAGKHSESSRSLQQHTPHARRPATPVRQLNSRAQRSVARKLDFGMDDIVANDSPSDTNQDASDEHQNTDENNQQLVQEDVVTEGSTLQRPMSETQSPVSSIMDNPGFFFAGDDTTIETGSILSDSDDIVTIMSLESVDSRASSNWEYNDSNPVNNSHHFPAVLSHAGKNYKARQSKLNNSSLSKANLRQRIQQNRPKRQFSLNNVQTNNRRRNTYSNAKSGLINRQKNINSRLVSNNRRQNQNQNHSLLIQGQSTRNHHKMSVHENDPYPSQKDMKAPTIRTEEREKETDTPDEHISPVESDVHSQYFLDANTSQPSPSSFPPGKMTGSRSGRLSRSEESIEDMCAKMSNADNNSEGLEHLEDLYLFFGYIPSSASSKWRDSTDVKQNIISKHDSYNDLIKPLLSPNKESHQFHQLET